MLSLKYLIGISILCIIVAYFYPKIYDYEEDMNGRLHQVLSGLLRAEKKISKPSARIAVGFGGCKDMFVDGLALLDVLNFTAPDKAQHTEVLDTQEQLSKMMAYFFQYGAAAE